MNAECDARQAQPIRRKAGATNTTQGRRNHRGTARHPGLGPPRSLRVLPRRRLCDWWGIAAALLGIDESASPPFTSSLIASRFCRSSLSQALLEHGWDMAGALLGIDKSWDTRPIRSCQPLVSLFTSPRHRGLKGPLLARHCGRQWDHSMASCVGKGLMSRGRACSASRGACLPVGCTGAPSDCSRVLRHPPSKKKIQFFSLCCGVDNLVCGETLSGPVVICWAQKLLNG